MEIKKTLIKYKNKEIPSKIYIGNKPQYIFVTHHGLISNKNSFRYFERFIKEKAIVVNYDARLNGENKMRASRMSSTYVRDLRDVIRWSKINYPNIPIVTIGSSWGATVVIAYAKKYSNKETYKNIAWSIPFNFTKSEDSKEENNKEKKIKDIKNIETTYFGYFWKFLIMILFNINAKSYTQIDLNQITNNKTIKRLSKRQGVKPTPVKLFWSALKSIFSSNRNLKKIDNRNSEDFLYFQSLIDVYFNDKQLSKLKKLNGKGVKVIFLKEGKHALQWEEENNLNNKVFEIIMKWLNKK